MKNSEQKYLVPFTILAYIGIPMSNIGIPTWVFLLQP